MKMTELAGLRLRVFALAGVAILGAYLSASINSFENGLIHIALLASLIAVGLATNLWGGAAASAVAAFAIILLNQYLGVFSRQFLIMNIASELLFYIVAGPLAGSLARTTGRMQNEIDRWTRLAERRTIHDDNFGALKPEWAKVRLEEEILRSKSFGRPLSIVLIKFDAAGSPSRAERIAALSALIRIMRSGCPSPAVISYIGNDQALLILPELTKIKAQQALIAIGERMKTELYFPDPIAGSFGKPLSQMGQILASVATLDKELNGDALLDKAISELK